MSQVFKLSWLTSSYSRSPKHFVLFHWIAPQVVPLWVEAAVWALFSREPEEEIWDLWEMFYPIFWQIFSQKGFMNLSDKRFQSYQETSKEHFVNQKMTKGRESIINQSNWGNMGTFLIVTTGRHRYETHRTFAIIKDYSSIKRSCMHHKMSMYKRITVSIRESLTFKTH